MKKTLAIILSLVMVFALLPVSAFADDGPKPYDPEDFVAAYISAYEVDSEGNYSGVDYYIFDTDPEAELNELEGVRYEPETNTLYLDNLEYPELVFETNGMGDDFTVYITGVCSIANMKIWGDGYGGSIRFEGSGTLEVNKDGYVSYGILVEAENSESAISFGKTVNVIAYGEEFTVGVVGTTVSDAGKAIVFENGEAHEVRTINPYEQDVQIFGFSPIDPEELDEPQSYGMRVNYADDPDGIYTATVLDFGFLDIEPDDDNTEPEPDSDENMAIYIIVKYAYCEEYNTYIPDFSAFDGVGMAFVLEDSFEEEGFSFVLEDGEPVEFINENPILMGYYTLALDADGNSYGLLECYDEELEEYYYEVYNITEVEGFEHIYYTELNSEINAEELSIVTQIVEPEDPEEPALYDYFINEDEFVYTGLNFPDVVDGNWYYDAALYCAGKGFITGYKNGRFGAADALQRQDFVVILARITGADLSAYEGQTGGLKDVAENAYYAPAVAWAVDIGIINGYQNGNFGVGDKITREQVATIFYRFMDSPDVDISLLDTFSDNAKVSSFAKEAMAWAVANGIISGKNGKLAPTDSASRAEIATIVMRMDLKDMFAL